MLVNEQKQRADVYISHSGDTLVNFETGEAATLYDHGRESGSGATWSGLGSATILPRSTTFTREPKF